MKHRSDHHKNGHYSGKKDNLYMDLRVPFAVSAAVGLVLLAACTAVGYLAPDARTASWFW